MYVGGAALGGILAGVFYNMHEKLFKRDECDNTQTNDVNDFDAKNYMR